VKIDLDQIRSLLSVVSSTDITELTIENGDEKITVKKGHPVAVAAPAPAHLELAAVPAAAHAQRHAPQPVEAPKVDNNGSKAEAEALLSITSPMVGTFYRASSPTTPPFVDVGDRVNVGQTVCIIEAMKLMNDLPSEVAGKVVKVLVENGSTVEFGQPLFMVDPRG
jgi:acetyl-CoA carboxylase biotin carboxyl carrier protein